MASAIETATSLRTKEIRRAAGATGRIDRVSFFFSENQLLLLRAGKDAGTAGGEGEDGWREMRCWLLALRGWREAMLFREMRACDWMRDGPVGGEMER